MKHLDQVANTCCCCVWKACKVLAVMLQIITLHGKRPWIPEKQQKQGREWPVIASIQSPSRNSWNAALQGIHGSLRRHPSGTCRLKIWLWCSCEGGRRAGVRRKLIERDGEQWNSWIEACSFSLYFHCMNGAFCFRDVQGSEIFLAVYLSEGCTAGYTGSRTRIDFCFFF